MRSANRRDEAANRGVQSDFSFAGGGRMCGCEKFLREKQENTMTKERLRGAALNICLSPKNYFFFLSSWRSIFRISSLWRSR